MAEQDYEHSDPEDNSAEEDRDVLVDKALIAADAIRSILEMLGDRNAIETVLADIAGEHLANAYCEEHRVEGRKRLIMDIDDWTEQHLAEIEEADKEEPRKLDS